MNRLRMLPARSGFDLLLGDTLVLRQRAEAPAFFLGSGRAQIAMYRGNFDIADRLDERVALRFARVSGEQVELSSAAGQAVVLTLTIEAGTLHIACADAATNRFWMRLIAEPGEMLWGAGEQMSYFNLAGRRFPLWTSEPGVGRDKSTELPILARRCGFRSEGALQCGNQLCFPRVQGGPLRAGRAERLGRQSDRERLYRPTVHRAQRPIAPSPAWAATMRTWFPA